MKLKLIRMGVRGGSTVGLLRSKKLTLSCTLENPEHCLPLGCYSITEVYCKQRRGRVLYVGRSGDVPQCERCPKVRNQSLDVPLPCFCPQFAIGNSACKRTDGCILVGKACPCAGVVVNSGKVYAGVIERLRKSLKRGFTFDLEIVEYNKLECDEG